MSTADNELRCNNLKCRAFLATEGQAVVTTCSHIFCVPCATTLFSTSLICPACSQSLQGSDGTVMTTLNPTNEYKASILAGLPPHTVLEIAARALSFWTYQLSQESAFQALILKNTQERQSHSEKQLNNAFCDLQLAHKKISSLENDLEVGRRKTQESVNESRRKDRELSKLRDDLDKIKRKTAFSQVAHGADMAGTPMATLQSSRNRHQQNSPMVNTSRRFVATPQSTQQHAPFRPQSSVPFEPRQQPFFATRSKSNADNISDGSGGSGGRFRGPRFTTGMWSRP
ncbi:hypothetical protein, variant [Cryptococcus amylolentus CBS 6039]|uniref:RING-type domain-containing protein n=1 Tax=Cryptococcus amylolentus CBS 6039 TaxID=1295533 RepID=A0A1E3I3H6_9TREE|nr:hypothetical protein, variant [Cryptococcus amylolentus CBS 6039]ODN83142.1 hypothetical protein, variant [Cryptococcus amylolentus CBS 6039]